MNPIILSESLTLFQKKRNLQNEEYHKMKKLLFVFVLRKTKIILLSFILSINLQEESSGFVTIIA